MRQTILYGILIGVLKTGTCKDYIYKNKEVTFDEAQKLCDEDNMDVAIASTDEQIQEMNSQLSKLSEEVSEVWIGLVYTGEGQQFKWTNGKPVSSARWDTITDDEPDQLEKQRCAVWRRKDFKWDSRECEKHFHLVCSSKDIDDLQKATFTLHGKDKQISKEDAEIVTSRSDIDCAVACRRQMSCSAFSVESSTRLCSMFSLDSIDGIEVSDSPGSNVWKLN